MTQFPGQTRRIQKQRKDEIKDYILSFINYTEYVTGSTKPSEPSKRIQAKGKDFQASFREIEEFFIQRQKRRNKKKYKLHKHSYITDRKGRKLSIGWRTLYRYIKELLNEGFIEEIESGVYRLTGDGIERCSLINALTTISEYIIPEPPLGTFFQRSRARDKEGRTKYIDIIIRVTSPDVIRTIEKAYYEDKAPGDPNELGYAISNLIILYFRGIFQRIPELAMGKEAVLLEFVKTFLPIHEESG